MKKEIEVLEERIRIAQLNNDVGELDDLLADELQFVFFNGSVASKADDIEAHRNKVVVFNKIVFSDQSIICFDHLATVTVKAEIEAVIGDHKSKNVFRYGRTWAKFKDMWKLVAGNVTQIEND